MIKKYHLPITGTVKSTEPLLGDPLDPIAIIPIYDKRPKELQGIFFSYGVQSYDIEHEEAEVIIDTDEKVHEWLEAEIKSVPKLHDLIAKHGFKPLKRMDLHEV
jgi:hypothetical protein